MGDRRLGWAVAAAATTAAVAVASRMGDLITNDGPQHRFACAVNAHYHDATTRFDEEYLLNDALTSRGYMELCGALEPVVGLDVAHAVIVASALLLPGWAWMLLASLSGRGRWSGAVVMVPLSFQWTVFTGLLPFALAMGLLPLILAAAVRFGTGRLVGVLTVGGLLTLQAQSHLFAAMATGLVLGWLWLWADRSPRAAVGLLAAGTPALAVLLLMPQRGTTATGMSVAFDDTASLRVLELFLPGTIWTSALLTMTLLLSAAAVWRFGGPRERALTTVGAVFLLVGAFAPRDAFGWQLFNARFVAVGIPLIVGSVPWERLGGHLRRALTVAAVALGALHLGWSWGHVAEARDELRPILDAAARAPSMAGFHWSLVVVAGPPSRAEEAIRHQAPYFHLAQQVAPILGGSPGFSHDDDETVHHMLNPRKGHRWITPELPELATARWRWPEPPEDRHRRLASHFAGLSRFEKLLVVGYPDDAETLRLVGYSAIDLGPVDADRRLILATFVGCDAELQISDPNTTAVEVGFGPDEALRDAFAVGADGRIDLLRYPCGPVWLRFVDGACGETQSDMAYLFVGEGSVEGTCIIQGGSEASIP